MKPLTSVSAMSCRPSHKYHCSTLESPSRMHRSILYEASSPPRGAPQWPLYASLDLVAKFLGSTAPLHSSLNSRGEEIDSLFISITMRLKLAHALVNPFQISDLTNLAFVDLRQPLPKTPQP